MPGSSTVQRGNLLFEQALYLPLVTVPNLPANSIATQVVNVPGVLIGDVISQSQQSLIAGIAVENAFVSATGQVTFVWSNATIAAVNGTAPQPFEMIVSRPENIAVSGLGGLPNSII